MRIKILQTLLMLIALADLRSEWNGLVEAEKAFARTSVAKGTKEAFLSVLDDQSVIFRPRAVPGRKWFQENPASPVQLNWQPEFADIATAGDLGYTTGPWEMRRTPQDPPDAFGHYVTVWRKQPGGEWKVAIDIGIGHDNVPKPATVDSPPLAQDTAAAKPRPEVDAARTAIVSADKAAMTSLPQYLAPDVRLYRDGSRPFAGKAAAEKRLSEVREAPAGTQAAAVVSAAADLGYTYGSSETANYMRIWKKQRDGSWKIVLDLATALPKQ
jgi:ketosteroid isomerase-like protein